MNRIAIVGLPQVNRSICARVLSDILGKTYLHPPSFDTEFQEIYHDELDLNKTFSEIYTVGLSQFHSRVLAEKCINFISDGSVLDEVVNRKLIINHKTAISIRYNMRYILFKKSYLQFGEKIDHLIEDYFVDAYDKIYLFANKDSPSVYSTEYETILKSIMDKNKTSYKLMCGNEISFISEVLKEQQFNGYEMTEIKNVINKYKKIVY